MNRYFYIHQDYFNKYYPACIRMNAMMEHPVVRVSRIGVASIDVTRTCSAVANMKKYCGKTRSFVMKTLPPKTYNGEKINEWFFANTDDSETYDRFITREERERVVAGDTFTVNGPPIEDIQRMLTLLYAFYVRLRNENLEGYRRIKTNVTERNLDWFDNNGQTYWFFSYNSYYRNPIVDQILQNYPTIVMFNNLFTRDSEDLTAETSVQFTIPFLRSPRELLGLEKNLYALLSKYRLGKILPPEIYSRLALQ